MSEGGKRTCKYYRVCGNTENCKRCTSYEKDRNTIIIGPFSKRHAQKLITVNLLKKREE